ncbi:MAG: hypothetical protein N2376_14675 [Clostridia bacterium]|nr:hypothetical protein [Clostridia bacterium]
MPYCVRCGVELQKDSKACPLCQTEVILPPEHDAGGTVSAYPDYMPRRRRPTLNLVPSRGFLFLVTFLLVLPMVVTFIIDFKSTGTLTWSFYPIASLALLWILIAYPALLKGNTVLLVLTVDIFAILLFLISMDLYSGAFMEWAQYPALSLFLIWIYAAAPLIFTWNRPIPVVVIWFLGTAGYLAAMNTLTGGDWFLPLALPIISLLASMALIAVIIAKAAKSKPLLISGMSMLFAVIFFTGADVIINLYLLHHFDLTWSPITSAVLIPTAIFLIMINNNSELRLYLQKKFHV